jgi:hypothetical protein
VGVTVALTSYVLRKFGNHGSGPGQDAKTAGSSDQDPAGGSPDK